MRRYIVLLLITGIVWAQTDFDKLVLKDGTEYLGEYSRTEGKIVYFKPQEAFGFQPVPVKLIQTLKLKDGRVLLHNGIIKKNKHTLALEEYQKLNTKEKAIYDANLYNVKKWALYGPISTIIFGGCTLLYQWYDEGEVRKVDSGEWWESPIFLGGSSAASLSIPYLVLNNKEKFNFPKSILTDSEKEIYKQAYSKKLKKRKFKYIVGSTIITGALAFIYRVTSGISGSINMGPGPY